MAQERQPFGERIRQFFNPRDKELEKRYAAHAAGADPEWLRSEYKRMEHTSANPAMKAAVVQSPNLPRDLVEKALQSGDAQMRAYAALRPDVPEQTRNIIAIAPNPIVRGIMKKEMGENFPKRSDVLVGRNKGPRVREEYLEGEPQAIANFMRNFQPQNDNEKSRFNYLLDQLESGKSLKSHYFVLADIGYGDVLQQLYKDSPKSYEVRSRVMENPHCPESVLAEGLKDDHPLVRKAAVENQNLSQMLVYNHARQEQDPAVKEALEKRLGKENYQAATQGITGTRSRFENPVKAKKPSLEDQIKGAKTQHEAQLAAFQKLKEQGAVIGGTAKTPFVPTR